MLTKTFRAPNMLMALKNVQAELGADAMILSMREVPAGPIWATWKKPGVEVIASKTSKSEEKRISSSKTEESALNNQENRISPSQEELKKEIENLKLLVTGQKMPAPTNTLPLVDVKKSKPTETKNNPEPEETHFDFEDFKALKQGPESRLNQLSEKTEAAISKTNTVVIEKKFEPEIPSTLMAIKQSLLDQGVNAQLINKIIDANLDALSPSILEDYSRLDRFIKHQLTASLPPTRKSLALVPSKVMALTGLSGCGKTSCCAKLASFYMITMGKKVVWIEADTVRTSAIAEARTYAETLGIPLFLAYTPQELAELLESQKDADLILVDTAGCNPRNEDNVVELGSFLSVVPSGCTYLIASATTKEQDLSQTEKTLHQFGLKGVILTKTDETGSFGASYNLLWQSKLPLYFVSSGHQIFGNLKPGNPEQLAAAVVDGDYPEK
jgi:flagellar biosynthesis protein FlhF